MGDKKRVTILVVVALILAITTIAMNVFESKEVLTEKSISLGGSGEVGIEIQPAPVEDKLAQEIAVAQS